MKHTKRIAAAALALLLTVALLPLGAGAAEPRFPQLRELIPMAADKEELHPLAGSDMVPQAAYTSGTCGDNLTWSVEGRNLTISGTGDMYNFSDLDNPVPWSESRNDIYHIYVEEGVTSIGDYAFSNIGMLTNCFIAASVSYVGNGAFFGSTERTDGARVQFLGDAPEFHENAFQSFGSTCYYFRPWDEAVLQNYGGTPSWKRGTVILGEASKQFYALNEEIKAEDLAFRAYIETYTDFAFDYTPAEIIIGAYDNSTYGGKSVTITADGHEMTLEYYVTDGSTHLDLITVEYDPIAYYTHRAITLDPLVKAGDKVLKEGEDYIIFHQNNVDVSNNASFTIMGQGLYEGFQKTYPFAILKRDLSDAVIYVEPAYFYGQPMEPIVLVSVPHNNGTVGLSQGTDYELIYEDNVNVGTATVRVVGKGGFYGTATQTFEIIQGETTLTLPGAYNGSAQDDALNEDIYYAEGILCPGVFTGRVEAYNHHIAYYALYRVEGEELVLVTEYESDYSHNLDTAFTYDFTDVYNSTSEEGGETYLLAYTWLDMDYDVYSGALLMFVPARVPDATVMDMASLPGDGDFRREYLAAAGVDGVLDGLTITSSDETVASIESGIMTLKHPGAVTITANAGNAVLSQDLTVEALDLDDGVIFSFDPTGGSANVIYDGLLLEAGTDYAINVKTDDGITEVWAEGKGLFSGLIMRQFDSNGDAIGHTHAFENACDADCETCDFVREQGHSYTDTWTKDMDGHWHACSVCGDKTDYAEHTLNDAGECTVCGPLYTPGDLDGSLTVNEDDAIYLLQHVLLPDFFPVYQPVDYDHNGLVNEDDAIYLLQHVLLPEFFPLG